MMKYFVCIILLSAIACKSEKTFVDASLNMENPSAGFTLPAQYMDEGAERKTLSGIMDPSTPRFPGVSKIVFDNKEITPQEASSVLDTLNFEKFTLKVSLDSLSGKKTLYIVNIDK